VIWRGEQLIRVAHRKPPSCQEFKSMPRSVVSQVAGYMQEATPVAVIGDQVFVPNLLKQRGWFTHLILQINLGSQGSSFLAIIFNNR
jgi:hypothetical protein